MNFRPMPGYIIYEIVKDDMSIKPGTIIIEKNKTSKIVRYCGKDVYNVKPGDEIVSWSYGDKIPDHENFIILKADTISASCECKAG